MTKYLVSGYVGFDNFGDEAIAYVLAEHLKSLNPEKITWISGNPQKTASDYGVNAVKMSDFIKAIDNCDVLISGGGSLLQDITSLKSLLYYLAVIMYALFKNKRVFIFSQGFTPFRTVLGEFLVKFVLKRCHYISVRDINSKKLLSKWQIHSELVPDPVWGINISQNEHKGVGIQLRSFPSINNMFLNSLADNVAKYFPNSEIKLISLQNSSDIPVLEIFQELLNKKGIKSKIIKNTDLKTTTDEISSLEYLIAMRFHACLVGAKAGVKVLGINYDKKVERLSKEVKFPIIEINENKHKNFFKIFDINVEEYNIPQTYFPDFN